MEAMASTFRPHEVVLPRYLYARYSLPIPVDSSTAKIENKDELKNSISACQGPADSFVGDAEVGRAAGVEAPVPDGRCRETARQHGGPDIRCGGSLLQMEWTFFCLLAFRLSPGYLL